MNCEQAATRDREKKIVPVSIVLMTARPTSMCLRLWLSLYKYTIYSGEFHLLWIVIDWLGWPGARRTTFTIPTQLQMTHNKIKHNEWSASFKRCM